MCYSYSSFTKKVYFLIYLYKYPAPQNWQKNRERINFTVEFSNSRAIVVNSRLAIIHFGYLPTQ